jgi:Nucleotidyltransferase of unknown function (DUF6036)
VSEQTSRPATLEDLKTLLRSLNAHGVDYLLIGGYALAAHGYQRATTDIDIVFPSTTEAGHRVRDALMILPDQAAKELEPQWFEEGENIRVADAFDLDGIPVRTVSREGLLLTKQTMRDKDIADRLVIERALAKLLDPGDQKDSNE